MLNKTYDRFDFEQDILSCWGIVNELDLVINLIEKNKLSAENEDEIMNILIGLKSIYEAKFNNLFNKFEQLIKEKKII